MAFSCLDIVRTGVMDPVRYVCQDCTARVPAISVRSACTTSGRERGAAGKGTNSPADLLVQQVCRPYLTQSIPSAEGMLKSLGYVRTGPYRVWDIAGSSYYAETHALLMHDGIHIVVIGVVQNGERQHMRAHVVITRVAP